MLQQKVVFAEKDDSLPSGLCQHCRHTCQMTDAVIDHCASTARHVQMGQARQVCQMSKRGRRQAHAPVEVQSFEAWQGRQGLDAVDQSALAQVHVCHIWEHVHQAQMVARCPVHVAAKPVRIQTHKSQIEPSCGAYKKAKEPVQCVYLCSSTHCSVWLTQQRGQGPHVLHANLTQQAMAEAPASCTLRQSD